MKKTWLSIVTDGYESLITSFRELVKILKMSENPLPDEFKRAQQIAANLYLKHANRDITLDPADFNHVIDILKTKNEE
ncbi:MAG: hypothetical protein ACW99A_15875 [Candidatus Kariarchaeaceae archaeon]|jgi:flagellar biosynthesis regulator FlaF